MRNPTQIESFVNQFVTFIKIKDGADPKRYSRVCALIRINWSLGSWIQYINYEGLPKRCFRCNQLSHKIVGCQSKISNGHWAINLKKWVRKEGGPDADFVWRNNGMFLDHRSSSFPEDGADEHSENSSLPTSGAEDAQHQQVNMDQQLNLGASVNEELGLVLSSDHDPLDQADAPTCLKSCNIPQTAGRDTILVKGGKRRGRKTKAEKLRLDALDAIDEGTQWTMEELLTRSKRKQKKG